MLVEKIVKKGSKWQVQSEKGRNMGTYDTKEEAKERLRQVEYFKHKDESLKEEYDYSDLEDYVRHYMGDDDISLEEIYNEVFENEHDEDLANDVVAEIESYRNNERDYGVDESLTEASGKKYKVTGTLRNIWHDDDGNEVDREEWEETHTYTINSDNLPPEDLAKVKFEDSVTRYWNKRVRHDDGSEFEVEVTSVEPLNESLNEAKFSNATANDDVRLVRASYDHFINDLGEIPSPDDILYDILDNYNQDIFQEGGPYQEGKEIEAIKYILRSQGLEYRGDFDESLNEDDEQSFYDYMRSIFGDDDRWEENPDVEEYYRNEYESGLHDLDDYSEPEDHSDLFWPENHSEPKEEEPEEYEMTEEDYANMLDSYNITLEMSDEEAKAQIEKEFADMLSWGGISKEEYVEGQKEIFDTWKMLKERDQKPAPATEALYELWDFPDEDEEPREDCPKCGEPMAFIGYQGYEEEFKCPVCGEYFYFKDGKQIE